MRNKINLKGQIFGRLTVLSTDMVVLYGTNRSISKCLCSCGNEKEIATSSLKAGLTQSCGCIKREQTIQNNTTHGKSKMKEYKHWMYLKGRCNNPNTKCFHRYGGRGIKVCKRWVDSFDNFLLDMGLMPTPKHSVERVNNNKGYMPQNCVWATTKQQAENTSKTIKVRYKGEVQLMAYWAKKFGMPVRNLYKRYHNGMRGDKLFFKGIYPNTHKSKKATNGI